MFINIKRTIVPCLKEIREAVSACISFLKPCSTFVVCIFFSCIAWLCEGYIFGTGNHGQEVPPILSLIYPNLYSTDFAIQTFLEPGPRYAYYHLVGSISAALNIGVDGALLVLKIASHLSFFSACIFVITAAISAEKKSEYRWTSTDILTAGVFVFLCTFPLNSWGSDIYAAGMFPSTLAMAISIWSLFFAIKKKWLIAFSFAAAAVNFQFLVGLFSGLVLIPGLLISTVRARSWNRAAAPIAVWITPALVLYYITASVAQPVPESFDFFEVFGRFRVPHHWLPSSGTWYQWVSDALLLISSCLSFASILMSRNENRDASYLLICINAVVICGVVLNVLFVEVWPVTFIGKLQFQRIIPFGHLASYLLIILAARSGWESEAGGVARRRYGLVVTSGILSLPSILGIVITTSLGNIKFFIMVLAFVSATVAFAYGSKALRAIITSCVVALLLFVNIPPVSILPDVAAKFIGNRFRPLDSGYWSGVDISTWLRENSPIDAVIVIPPDKSEMSDLLALHARRSVFFSFKNVPYSDHGVWEWSRRAESLLGVAIGPEVRSDSLRDHWRRKSVDEIEEATRGAGACFLVDRIVDRRDARQVPIVTSRTDDGELWGLWRFESCGM